MAYQRLKTDSFQAFGGVNMKSSQADLSVFEFTDISNLDFNAAGALQQRPGSQSFITGFALSSSVVVSYNGTTGVATAFSGTMIIATGATLFGSKVSSIYEFNNLNGASFIIYSQPGGFNYGSSAMLQNFSLQQLYFVDSNNQVKYLLDPIGYAIGSTTTVLPGVGTLLDYPVNQNWTFSTFVNRMFFANGDHFYKWDGFTAIAAHEVTTTSPGDYTFILSGLANATVGAVYTHNTYSYTVLYTIASGLILSCSGSGAPLSSGTLTKFSGTGDASIAFSSVAVNSGADNITSYYSVVPSVYKYGLPAGTSLFTSNALSAGTSFVNAVGGLTYTYSYGFINDRGFRGPVSSPVTLSGTSLGLVSLFGFSTLFYNVNSIPAIGFTIPDGYGIGATQINSWAGISSVLSASTAISAKVVVYRDNGPGTGRYQIGFAYTAPYLSGASLYPQATAGFFQDPGFPTSTIPEPTCISATLAPQFLEIYNNQMFMAGFSQAPSTVQFSDIGEPESIQPENNFDVRTNDGDFLTGMKMAFNQLFIFKNKSFHALQGDNPDNFILNPQSDQYGCISHRAIATFQNYMVFLDQKGICLFNGAQVEVISQKLDPIFANMNIQAAQNNAWMVHNKQRNQVWCGIPVNGATLINQIIIYDYLLKAWTHFDGINTAHGVMGYGDRTQKTVYFGGYSGIPGRFGASLTSDFGQAITLMAKTRFISDMGNSVEKMWRRLFINQVSSIGATVSWNVNLYADYQTNLAATLSHVGQTFQTRTDFGVPAKALAIQFYASNASDILQLTGFTVESRYQRSQ